MTTRFQWTAAAAVLTLGAAGLLAQVQPREKTDREPATELKQQGRTDRAAQRRLRQFLPSAGASAPVTDRAAQRRTALRPVQASVQGHDQKVAGLLIPGNRAEVELSKFAQQQTKNDQVKEFAQMMIDEHSQMITQLQKFATSGDRASPTAAGNGGGMDPVQIKQQICERALDATKRELGRYQGAEFDQAYLGQQIADHIHMLAAEQVLRNHASSELQQVLDTGIVTTQKHLDHARQLMDSLAKEHRSAGGTGAITEERRAEE